MRDKKSGFILSSQLFQGFAEQFMRQCHHVKHAVDVISFLFNRLEASPLLVSDDDRHLAFALQ